MTPRLLLVGSLAALVPGVALWFAAPPDRAAVGLAVAPFGWPSLVVVQVLAALPLAACVATVVSARCGPVPTPTPVVVGTVLALLAWGQAHGIGDALDDIGFAGRVAARTLLCTALAVPWFLLAPAGGLGGRVPLLLGAVVAFGLPAIHADALVRDGIAGARTQLQAKRLARAAVVLDGVLDLAPDRTVSVARKSRVLDLHRLVAEDVIELGKWVAPGLRPGATPSDALAYAGALVKLDRSAEAEVVLRSLPPQPEVTLRLSEALENQSRHDENEALLRQAIDPTKADFCRELYDRLARSVSDRNRPAEAERVLREAVIALPDAAGYFQFQLGRHFQQHGRPADALAAFSLAAELDPRLSPRVESHRRDLRERTPGCLLGR